MRGHHRPHQFRACTQHIPDTTPPTLAILTPSTYTPTARSQHTITHWPMTPTSTNHPLSSLTVTRTMTTPTMPTSPHLLSTLPRTLTPQLNHPLPNLSHHLLYLLPLRLSPPYIYLDQTQGGYSRRSIDPTPQQTISRKRQQRTTPPQPVAVNPKGTAGTTNPTMRPA